MEYAFLHPDLMPFIITQLAGVLAQLTLLGWVDIEPYRNIYKDILQFIQVSQLIFITLSNNNRKENPHGALIITHHQNIYKYQYICIFIILFYFIKASMNHRIVGTQILAVITQDVNPPAFVKGTGKFRKAGNRIINKKMTDIMTMAYLYVLFTYFYYRFFYLFIYFY